VQIDRQQRLARLAVSELAQFALVAESSPSTGGGTWRTALGTAWHQSWEERSRTRGEKITAEVSIIGTLLTGNWRIQLSGRIDQVVALDDGRTLLREVKTTGESLPLAGEELDNRYPSYGIQLACYLRLYALQHDRPTPPAGELVYVDYRTGIHQTLPHHPAYDQALDQRLLSLVLYLEDRWQARLRRLQVTYQPAHATPREGQNETLAELQTHGNNRYNLLQAPTGFGKTAVALTYALEALREDRVDRIIYLTGMTTGQWQVSRHLEAMLGPANTALRYLILRNRSEHGLTRHDSPTPNTGPRPHPLIPLFDLFDSGTVDHERVLATATEYDINPYALTRALLGLADIWVGDYNYLFAPGSRHIMEEQPDFDPARTLLIVDEAHNLPARVQSAYTWETDLWRTRLLIDRLAHDHAPAPLLRAWEEWETMLESITTPGQLNHNLTFHLTDTVDTLSRLIQQTPWSNDAWSDEESDDYWAPLFWQQRLEDHTTPSLLWAPQLNQLRHTCLDAAAFIGTSTARFYQSLFMSATLDPVDDFVRHCGFPTAEVMTLRAKASWRDEAYRVAIDARPDTRLRSRERYYAMTADTVARLCATTHRPVVVFFPSYRYAETIKVYLESAHPLYRVAMQEKTRDQQAQSEFIDHALLTAHALFLILGSRFAESIDQLGGQIDHAMVVGPALPEVDAVQTARLDHLTREAGREQAFHRVYAVPAMRKINQALGRLVRAPGQQARILLHCRRFSDPDFRTLLAPEYRQPVILRETTALDDWLAEC
jgi:DNA excision repair protein ERCC-2